MTLDQSTFVSFWLRQADCKPNSVADSFEPAGNHSSRPQVLCGSSSLPGNYDGPSLTLLGAMFPYLALLRVGFAKPIRFRTAGALLPHLFTLTVDSGGIFSVALSVPCGPSNYEAHCPAEFGLSSASMRRDCPSACQPMILYCSASSAIRTVRASGIPWPFR